MKLNSIVLGLFCCSSLFAQQNNEVVMVIENGICKADITINMDKLCVKTDY